MADPTFDPLQAWQKFVSDWERQFNEASTLVTGSQEFSRLMSQATGYFTALQQKFDEQMETYLKVTHLPSKSDIAAIQERVAAIEDKLERLTQALGCKDRPATSDIPRTRRPRGNK
jgi:hypothetical protein